MALETLKYVDSIGGFRVLKYRPKDENGNIDWSLFDEMRKEQPIYVDDETNMISFRLQNGPIKEVGVNGCQVDTMIHASYLIIQKLNEKFPCDYNRKCLIGLKTALNQLENRKIDREKRNVEGHNKP